MFENQVVDENINIVEISDFEANWHNLEKIHEKLNEKVQKGSQCLYLEFMITKKTLNKNNFWKKKFWSSKPSKTKHLL